MTGTAVEEQVKGGGRNWRELVFSRLVPALFFILFLARQLVLLWAGLHSIKHPSDYLFVIQQALALAYFTMLVVLYSTRLPARGTDHRLAVVVIAFTGTFSAMAASFLPGGGRHDWLVIPADIMATAGLAYAVWGLGSLRRALDTK